MLIAFFPVFRSQYSLNLKSFIVIQLLGEGGVIQDVFLDDPRTNSMELGNINPA
jgi:hypothetical protein